MLAPQTRYSLARPGVVALALVALSLTSCSKVPLVGGKPAVVVQLSATAKANSCGQDAGNSMTFRVLQVTDASKITGASLTQLWDHEDKLLGTAFLKKDDGVIDPGKKQEFHFERDPKAKSVVLVGSFCKPQGTCWYYVSKGSKLKLTVDEYCLRASK
jgi:type VI secretion system VasD/TssJ family lipoprotein